MNKQKFLKKYKKIAAWLKANNLELEDIADVSKKVLAAASLYSQLVSQNPNLQVKADEINPPSIQGKDTLSGDNKDNLFSDSNHLSVDNLTHNPNLNRDQDDYVYATLTKKEKEQLFQDLQEFLDKKHHHIPQEQEDKYEQTLSKLLNMPVTAELDNHRLNHSLGIMGAEQHLRRYPGDTLAEHDEFQESGMAPNRGAFGWFTQNGQLTNKSILREKYYFAVQTLYLPDWNQNWSELKPWYKFRKMVVINPYDKIAVVGVVGDAGPAKWVGKQFGGCPEIIQHGKIWSKEANGRVILMFVNDPADKIELGVYNLE